jgi:putative tryptophan/tyrosine transport system substrate-binding protein
MILSGRRLIARSDFGGFMERREFITLVGGMVATWPFAARAEQLPPMPLVGFMHILSHENVPHFVPAFREGLLEQGFAEGRNVAIEYRWAEGQYDRLQAQAADLVRLQVAVIAATGGQPSPKVAMAATQTIPIVFTTNGDPVMEGLVASLNRPGGNTTGVTIFGPGAVTKRLQLLHEFVPRATTIGYLMNQNNPNAETELNGMLEAARSLGTHVVIFRASSSSELEAAFSAIAQQQVGGLVGASDTFLFGQRNRIAALAAQHQVPAIYYLREFAQSGGLMAYGNRLTDVYRLAGIYVGRILKGEKPADLPVVQPTKFEFVLNLAAARALGLEVSSTLMALADEVIE